jgi:SAM-dependent methyltransferase
MTDPALSFGKVAALYDRGRPTYPRDAVTWLVGSSPTSVLELGAGTGKLTEVLFSMGHDVFATDPDDRMLDILSVKLPHVRATAGTAEQIPAPDGSYDVVVAGQAYHWFDQETALAEIARVLKPGGHLALVWNERDERIPWVKKLGRIIDTTGRTEAELEHPEIPASGLFSAVESAQFRHWQTVNRDSICDLVLSRSNLNVLSEEERERKRAEVVAFYDDYGRGMDGMQLPYTAYCFRAAVVPKPVSTLLSSEPQPHHLPLSHRMSTTDTADRLPRILTEPEPASDDDTGMILIDFR